MDVPYNSLPLRVNRKGDLDGRDSDKREFRGHFAKENKHTDVRATLADPGSMASQSSPTMTTFMAGSAFQPVKMANSPTHVTQRIGNVKVQSHSLPRPDVQPKKEAFDVLLEMERKPGTDTRDLFIELRRECARLRHLYNLDLSVTDAETDRQYMRGRAEAMEAEVARLRARLDANVANKAKKL